MRSFLALASAVLMALAAACKASPTAPASGIVSLPATGGSGMTDQPASGGAGTTLSASSVDVVVQDFLFAPAMIRVKVGTTVRWTNRGPSPHAVMSDIGGWGSGTLNAPMGAGDGMGWGMGDGMGTDGMGGGTSGGAGSPGGTFEFTFNTVGTYPYHCPIHPQSAYPGFSGTVVVTP